MYQLIIKKVFPPDWKDVYKKNLVKNFTLGILTGILLMSLEPMPTVKEVMVAALVLSLLYLPFYFSRKTREALRVPTWRTALILLLVNFTVIVVVSSLM